MSKKTLNRHLASLYISLECQQSRALVKTPSLVFEKEIAFLACTLNKAEKITNARSISYNIRGTTPIVTYQPLNENV